MVLILLAVVLGIAFLIWLWRVPVRNFVDAMKEEGSSTIEAYAIIFLLTAGFGFSIYLISKII